MLSRRKREWHTEGLWLYGSTGTGKSHRAYEGYDDGLLIMYGS